MLARQLGRTVRELFATMDSREFEEHLWDYAHANKPIENETPTPDNPTDANESPADQDSLRQIFGA